eukprot:6468423-Prymnesium_polylepis.2
MNMNMNMNMRSSNGGRMGCHMGITRGVSARRPPSPAAADTLPSCAPPPPPAPSPAAAAGVGGGAANLNALPSEHPPCGASCGAKRHRVGCGVGCGVSPGARRRGRQAGCGVRPACGCSVQPRARCPGARTLRAVSTPEGESARAGEGVR